MTQEIKDKLEQAAETAWEQVQNEKLEYLESDNVGLREIVEELKSQLAKYREVLERLLDENMCSHAGDELITEALKQEVNNDL